MLFCQRGLGQNRVHSSLRKSGQPSACRRGIGKQEEVGRNTVRRLELRRRTGSSDRQVREVKAVNEGAVEPNGQSRNRNRRGVVRQIQ